MYVISRCLLGCNCKYNGGNNEAPEVISFCRNHSYVSVCPETAGGLPSPDRRQKRQETESSIKKAKM